mgnify:CR=1 FL=1
MRHQKTGRKFGRNSTHRRAMFRNLAANLVLHERVETTDAKAKELRRIVEPTAVALVIWSLSLSQRRLVLTHLNLRRVLDAAALTIADGTAPAMPV